MIYTFETGNPDLPAILFLHGGGISSKSWLPVIERLPDFHCLAPDMPEQGRSQAMPFHIEETACLVADIIRQRVPGRKAHLVGLSLGGPVIFTLLRIAPELVDHVLISGSSGQISRLSAAIGKSSLWVYRLFKKEYLVRTTMRQQGIPPQYQDLLHDDLLAGVSPEFLRHVVTELASWRLPEQTASPLLFCVGEKEVRAAKTFASGYLKHFPGAKGYLVPEAGHIWCLQNPDLFANTVRAWVMDQPLPPVLKPMR